MKFFTTLFCCILFAACAKSDNTGNSGKEPVPEVDDSQIAYHNPVIRIAAPDPTVIRVKDGTYYLYATEDIRNVPIFKSENMIDWEEVGTAFTKESRPDFIDNKENLHAAIWAPEIQYVKNKYVLFYSLAKWGNHWVSTVGYAVSDSPEGPFEVQGKVFDSHDVNVENSIDQFFYEEDGKYYMLWGSFFGIFIMELEITDDMKITPKLETKHQIAGNAYEGINLWKRDGYYYLFGSTGSCCEGKNSTYTTVVGRSKDLLGPYVNKKGEKMLENAHEIVLKKNDRFVGTGHNAILQEDDEKNTWMFYHAFELAELSKQRQVLLDRVLWDDQGWPYVEKQEPSYGAFRPVINK
ncbi:family 43 glycosylhydrolase [Massilibacteroides sp.]|uniref:family 43 glycosylhydrolase n=1 Tax=Massilibacteroides sp. TaxID=2034766 RepID=UPI00261C98DC|nr:family 43 glycosylhydrolase [Massilibacteroides sp.]MDD4514092.1 family 43 glycosylhydrolase [Massilibacteroides sp.]